MGDENVVGDSGFVQVFDHFEETGFYKVVLRGPVQQQVVLGFLEVPFAKGLEFIWQYGFGTVKKLNLLDSACLM